MTRYTLILNVGLAKSGTTAANSFMKKHPDISIPLGRKELKYFMRKDGGIEDYISHFTNDGPVLFESSPPYTSRGVRSFRTYMSRVSSFAQSGHRVIVLFCIRDFVKRAFSHYWHEISVHHAIYGSQWSCRSTEDSDRYESLYEESFSQQISPGKGIGRYLPQCASMIRIALENFGSENVRICPMNDLDSSLHELCEIVGLPPRPEIRSSRIMSASSPLYLRKEDPLWENIPDFDSSRLGDNCLLLSRQHKEILDSQSFDLDRIISAAQHWTYAVDRSDLPEMVVSHTLDQADQMAALPQELFLQSSQESLVEELRNIPERLEIRQIRPSWAEIDAFLGGPSVN